VRNISDFRELNRHRVRKPYPIPKMRMMGHLDLNMDYYTIRLDPAASKMHTIILPWGKYSNTHTWALEAQPIFSKPR
jgi:hypothetical protein